MTDGPDLTAAFASMTRSRLLRPPGPFGSGRLDHAAFQPVLDALRDGGLDAVVEREVELGDYLHTLGTTDPDTLARTEALAYWLNLYNAGAVAVAVEARQAGLASAWSLPGAFSSPRFEIAGESLSLDGIEHGKVRRFGDPRIHAALVCASASCPTLLGEPFDGDALDGQLDDQMRHFLAHGGIDVAGQTIVLSRILKWYGRDFTHPRRMPTLLPVRGEQVLQALEPWLDPATQAEVAALDAPVVEFATYDWSLACAVR